MTLPSIVRTQVLMSCLLCPVGAAFSKVAFAQGVAGIRSLAGRPFVTSVTPVIGPRGVVGGVSVDADGVVAMSTKDEVGLLRQQWLGAFQPQAKEITQRTPLRMVSLSRLDQALAELLQRGQSPTEAMFFLAGLQRVEYVFVFPERHDVVLAGPAEGWRTTEAGEIVGLTSRKPVMRLDDLMEALRTTDVARTTGISCSIEPSEQGLKRYARLLKKRRLLAVPGSVPKIEQAMGPQRVIVKGVEADGHFARVMVSADYIMKRLAMGFEPSPVDDMPNYLAMVQRRRAVPQISSPRWWMTVNYQPLLHSPDRLAWQIRGQGIKTLTQDSVLDNQGVRTESRRDNPIAQLWADRMTEHFDVLSTEYPVLGQLRNCVDLAVIAALIAKRDLLGVANCQLDVLLDGSRLRGPQFTVPSSVDSRVSFVQARRGWIISVSGGVDIDSWSAVEKVESSDSLESIDRNALQPTSQHWWWQPAIDR